MSYYVFVTDACKKDSKSFGLDNEVKNLIDKTIKEQHISFFDNFPPPFLKKRFSRQERLIASLHQLEEQEETIIIFHRILKRGGNEYLSFIEDPKSYGEKYFIPSIDEKRISEWLEHEKTINKPKEKDNLNEEEINFIWHVSSKSHEGYRPIENEHFIYESTHWYQIYQSYKNKYGYENIKNELIKGLDDYTLNSTNTYSLKLNPTGNDYILFAIIENVKIIFLIGIFEKRNEKFINLPEHYYKIIYENEINEDEIYKNSLKAYPYFLLLDEKWSEIQENKSTNLALSPEEKKVLIEVISNENKNDRGFPLFLNGRAGSGKSTLLQYLFAEYLSTYILWKNQFPYKPIYLSYSKELIKIANSTVEDILTLGHRFDFKKEEIETNSDIANSFQTFTIFLRSLLPKEISDNLNEKNYINYSIFSKEWNKKYRNDNQIKSIINADISWHVIRTYIKGFNSYSYLDKEDYQELSRANKSVSPDIFNLIYDKIWEGWYKGLCNLEDKYWDDLDLVRYVLENNFVKPNYSAIFCDEAQDFTQVELDFLYKSTLYSNRKLTTTQIKLVPIAFAGDQFQTLNPTGFKWDSIRASYTEKFISSLVPWEVKKRPQLHFRELQFNYRSQHKIVKLCNSLQAIRSIIFKIDDLSPQECWSTKDNDTPKLIIQKFEAGEYIKDNLGVRIIVPCNLGEEELYFTGEAFLYEYAPKKDGFPLTVESAMRAKGQEYDEVIVYGFGNYYLEKKFPSIESLTKIEVSPEKMLEIEYFFNKLYVAISRAKFKLFVIDTEEAKNTFWKFLYDKSIFTNFTTDNQLPDKWSDLCELLIESTPDEMKISTIDSNILAKQKEDEGIKKMDSFILKQAAGLYSKSGNIKKSNFCDGEAYQILEDYKRAAEHFKACEQYEKSFINYWKCGDLNALIEITHLDKALVLKIENKFAELAAKPNVDNFQSLCASIKSHCQDTERRFSYTNDNRFNKILQDTIAKFIKDDKFDSHNWDRVYNSLDVLVINKLYKIDTTLAKIAWRANRNQTAIEIFEECNDFSSTDYKDIKTKLLIEKIESNDYNNFNNREKELSILYLTEKKYKYDLIAQFSYDLNHSDSKYYLKFEDNLKTWLKNIKEKNEVADKYFDLLFKQSKFIRIFSLLQITNKHYEGPSIIFDFFKANRQDYIIKFIKQVSINDKIPTLKSIEQAPITDFLKKYFIDDSKEIEWNIHPLVIGSAFERAGQHIKSDQFYEKMMNREELEYGFKNEIIKRRIKIKRKLSEISDKKVADKYLFQSTEFEKTIGISNSEIPEYPVINSIIHSPYKKQEQVINQLDSFQKNGDEIILPTESNDLIPNVTTTIEENIVEKSKEKIDTNIISSKIENNSLIDSIFKIEDIEFTIDRINSKIILKNTFTNASAKYYINKAKWAFDEDISINEIDHTVSIIEWEINIRNDGENAINFLLNRTGITLSVSI